jgi:hypothetical protein
MTRSSSTTETLSDKYSRRRLIEANTAIETTVSNLWFDQNHDIVIELTAFSEAFYLELPVTISYNDPNSDLIQFFSQFYTTVSQKPLEELIGEKTDLYFDKELETISFTEERSNEFSISGWYDRSKLKSVDEPDVFSTLQSTEGQINRGVWYTFHSEGYGRGPGVRTEIKSVVFEEENEIINFAVQTHPEDHIFFHVPLDKSTDPESSDSARLIEHVGGGSPDLLEGSDVYLIHQSDVPPKLDYVCRSHHTSEWHLVTPQDMEQYLDLGGSFESEETGENEPLYTQKEYFHNRIKSLAGIGLAMTLLIYLSGELTSFTVETISTTMSVNAMLLVAVGCYFWLESQRYPSTREY